LLLVEDGDEVELSSDAIIEAAQRRSNSTDIGDRRFLDGLRAVVSSFRDDVWDQLRPEARPLITRSLVDILVSRISILKVRQSNPDIAKVSIARPIVFIGMGRTGSTLIQTLLAQDPANVAVQMWETIQPSPPPCLGFDDLRRRKVSRVMEIYLGAMPKLLEQHPYFIDDSYRALAECGNICEKSFANFQFFAFFATRSHFDWLKSADHSETAEFHKMFLQHLQWGREGRTWVLKAVEHGLWLESFARVYPDATFVWTHRDPLRQAASLASTLGAIRARCQGSCTEPKQLGSDAVLAIRETIDRGIRARRSLGESRFVDLYFQDLVRDPLSTVRRLYERLGRRLTAEAELAMELWLRANTADKGGKHKYSAEEFGLDRTGIRRELGEYLEWFGPGLAASEREN
jgi:hypothetical protein